LNFTKHVENTLLHHSTKIEDLVLKETSLAPPLLNEVPVPSQES
jgi:hypothetical protein